MTCANLDNVLRANVEGAFPLSGSRDHHPRGAKGAMSLWAVAARVCQSGNVPLTRLPSLNFEFGILKCFFQPVHLSKCVRQA